MKWLVYLAGPIYSQSYEQSVEWRSYVTGHLPRKIHTLSPMRGKTYLIHETSLEHTYEQNALSTGQGITTRDRLDVMRSDLVLVNLLGAEKASIGSCIELGWADAFRKPVVVVMDATNIHWHGMVRAIAGFITPSLDEAIDIVKRVLLPDRLQGV